MPVIAALLITDILHLEWYHNSLRNWLTSAATAAIVFVGLMLVKRLLISRVASLAARTTNNFDDMFVGVLSETRTWILLAFAIYSASQSLDLARVDQYLHPLAKLVLLWQVGLWGSAGVTFWIKRYMTHRTDSNDRASIAMITAMGVGGKVILWTLLMITALKSVFALEITPLITGLGVSGIAVALAVQNILGDLLAALAIVFDHPFDVGDFIQVDQISGTVEHIGLKTTRLRSLSGEQVILGNGDLLKSRLRNYRRMFQRRIVLNFDVAMNTPADKLERLPIIIKEIISNQSPVKFDRSHVLGFTGSAIRLEAVYIVLDPDYTTHMDIQQKIHLEILRRLEAEQVQLAYPTQVVYVAPGADGPAVSRPAD